MPTCRRCGTQNADDAKVCRQCGGTFAVSTGGLELADVLAAARQAAEEAEQRARSLESELQGERQLRLAVTAERDGLAARLTEAQRRLERAEGDLATGTSDHEALRDDLARREGELADTQRALAEATAGSAEHQRLAATAAESTARIAELEQRLKAERARTGAPPRTRWLAMALAAAAVLGGSVGLIEHQRARLAQTRWSTDRQSLSEELAASRERETRLRDEVAALGRPPSVPAPAGGETNGVEGQASRNLEVQLRERERAVSRRSDELDARARAIADRERQAASERERLAADRRELDQRREAALRPREAAPRPAAVPEAMAAATEGFFVWQGRVDGPTTVVIRPDGSAPIGVSRGALPGRNCAMRDETRNAKMLVRPGPANKWSQAHIAPVPGQLATVLIVWTCR